MVAVSRPVSVVLGVPETVTMVPMFCPRFEAAIGEVLYSTTHPEAVPFSDQCKAIQSTLALSNTRLVGAGQVGM